MKKTCNRNGYRFFLYGVCTHFYFGSLRWGDLLLSDDFYKGYLCSVLHILLRGR